MQLPVNAHAAAAPTAGRVLVVRGTAYPVLLPTIRDPRLHLAATIVSLQVIGQVGFHFQLSIAQILLALATCGVLEVAIAFGTRRVLMWPASALLTGNGVAFILRIPGTSHGDWWSLRGWPIVVAVAAGSLLSKYVIKWRGSHVFNPSNLGLVVCFVALGRNTASPLDFWWGPMSGWLLLALAIIAAGGFSILSRLGLLRVALGFWAAFAAGIGVLALSGHVMTARWHLGPITGFYFWWVLVTSPEVFLFLFFMITDPKTAPRSPAGRLAYGVAIGLLASVLIAPTTTEFAAKVALLGTLTIVCAALPLLRLVPLALNRRFAVVATPAALALCAGAIIVGNAPASGTTFRALPAGTLPPIQILPSRGVATPLDRHTAELIAHDLLASTSASTQDKLRLWLEPAIGQGPPVAVAQLADVTYHLHQIGGGRWALGSTARTQPAKPGPRSTALDGQRLTNVAPSIGLDFRQGAFRFGVDSEAQAMMGGGVCWLDYNNDGWEDLYAVNSYSSTDETRWQAHGGLPQSALFENVHGTFRNVSRSSHAGLRVQGDGCVAADLNGDGRTDLVVTTTNGIDLLWNNGNGTFSQGARAAGMTATGWYTGVTVADVNGDGRPDVFVAGYTAPNEPVPNSLAGFPTNLAGVRDLLYLNEGNGANGRARFREVGIQAGLEAADPRHGLGAQFLDVNGDGRPDLYVADDGDPNQLYINVPWPGGARADPAGLGFRFEERGTASGVADPYAGMGIASWNRSNGSLDLFVTNSRNEPSAAFGRAAGAGSVFANARPSFDPALGTNFAGWGATWVDLANSGTPDLVLAAGGIPVTSLSGDAEPVRVLAPAQVGKAASFGDATAVLGKGLKLNGRGVAAADVDNDGRMDIAINTIGGKLVLLRPSGPSGHWLDVKLSRFSPGAVITVVLSDGRRLTRQVQAGTSYLSSEDPRVHFGLGAATAVRRVVVRYPWGRGSRLANVPTDRVVTVPVPAPAPARTPAAPQSPVLQGCRPESLHGASIAGVWNQTAVAALQADGEVPPVQARDLFGVSAAMWDAWAAYDPAARGYYVTEKAHAADVQSARETAISYAAYRLLLWRASFGSNLMRTFGLITARLRSLCLSPDFTSTAGTSPAALGNRIAAAAIAAGRHDGSLESLHYVDPSYAAPNAPLLVSQAGSTVRDATFWQPLALGTVAGHGLAAVPERIQTFVGARWGYLHGFALPAVKKGVPIDPGPPPLGLPTSRSYKQAAVAVIRATAGAGPVRADVSPLAWSRLATALPGTGTAAARLRHDVELAFALGGALDNAAIATWGAKRRYQAPRPISMIRYLAFQGQSSDPKAPSYSREGLPLVPGLIELITKADAAPGKPLAALAGHVGQIAVRLRGRWVLATRWTSPAPTPASPGGVAESSAFAYAAAQVLHASTGRSFAADAERAGTASVAAGIDVPSDTAAGAKLGTEVGARAVALARRYTTGG